MEIYYVNNVGGKVGKGGGVVELSYLNKYFFPTHHTMIVRYHHFNRDKPTKTNSIQMFFAKNHRVVGIFFTLF